MSAPLYVVLSGIDGSGKTAILDGVERALQDRRIPLHRAWMRYTHIAVRPLHLLARLTGLSTPPSNGRAHWRHRFARSPIFWRCYLVATWLDTWLGRLSLMLSARARGARVVLCDRWIEDILIDLSISGGDDQFPTSTVSRRFRAIAPASTLQIVVMRETATLLEARAASQNDEDFPRRLSLYGALVDRTPKHQVLINGSTLEAACDFLIAIIDLALVNSPRCATRPAL